MLSTPVMEHLLAEISSADPWRLETNGFEKSRYATMLELCGSRLTYESGLEVGCAAGAFTHLMARRCQRLRVLDVLPEAIERCRARLGARRDVVFSVVDIYEAEGWGEAYDLIVISEVLYYLESPERVAGVVAKLCGWLTPGGELIFGSAIDSVSRGWGLPCGAESAASEFGRHLRELERRAVVGRSPNEHALIIKYTRDA